MNLVVLGGSSPWTFDLVSRLDSADITLVGRDRSALEALSNFLASYAGVRVKTSHDPLASLREASLVVCQARIGGYEGRFEDENGAAKWDCYGDETLGLGGLRGAIRARSTIESWARAAGDAPTIMVSNPTDLLSRLWQSVSGATVISACEAPTALLASLPAECSFLGVNHLGYAVTNDGRVYGLRWTELLDDLSVEVRRQRSAGVPRAKRLSAISNELRRCIAEDSLERFVQLLAERPPFWYQELLAPLVNCMLRGEEFDGVVGRPNRGIIAGVPEGVYVEATADGLANFGGNETQQAIDRVSSWAMSRHVAWQALIDTCPRTVEDFLLYDPFSVSRMSDVDGIVDWLRSAR